MSKSYTCEKLHFPDKAYYATALVILSLKFNNRSKYEKTAINNDVLFFHIELSGNFRERLSKFGSKRGRKKANFWSKCGRRSLKQGGRLIQ